MKFTEKHGHSRVPRNPKEEMLNGDSNNLRLSRWVSQCRAEYRKAPDDRLHLDDINIFILNKLGFDWDPSETKFQARREQLKAFKEKHGHCRVPYNKYNQEDDGLSAWVKRQVRISQDGVIPTEAGLLKLIFCSISPRYSNTNTNFFIQGNPVS